MSPDPAVEALIADGTWNASPLGACGVRRMVRGRVAEGLVRLVREADSAEPVRAALAELVALKDGPKDERYYERRPGAWDRARAALAADREPEPREEEGGRPDYVQRMRDLAESVGERNERIRMLREDQDA